MADIYVAATGNDTTGTGTVGNPYATLGKAGSVFAAGDTIFVKYSASPYVLSSATANVTGGTLTISLGGETTLGYVVGYDTNAAVDNTDANRPTIQIPAAGVTTVTVINCSAAYAGIRVRNIIVDGAGKTSITGFAGAVAGAVFERCKALNCTTGFNIVRANACLADTCGTGFNGRCALYACVSVAHTVVGFTDASGGTIWDRCIAHGGTGATTDGFLIASNDVNFDVSNCVARGNGRDGFRLASSSRANVRNCISVANTGFGYLTLTTTTGSSFRYCAAFGNTGGASSFTYPAQSENFLTLTGDPFTNAAGGDFSLNNTAGAGAACRAAGFPGVFTGGLTTGYLDIGAAQHQDAGVGSVVLRRGGTVMKM